MKKASFVVPSFYQKNRIFDLADKAVNRDNCLHSFYQLKEEFEKKDYQLSTSDLNKPSESHFVLFNEMPNHFETSHDPENSYLLLFETELIRPKNWNFELHKYFKKIFTWNDDLIDNIKYFKMNFSHCFPNEISRVPFSERKLACLIAGNKTSPHPLELYSERLKTILWFEQNHPNQFDYYGMGWDQINLKSRILNKIAKKIKLSRYLKVRTSPCYRGKVDVKNDTLKNYKFSICYENAKKISGYITEKIFDSFFAGCIPVYWGAPNIAEHIPKECYIDRRDFSSHQDLYTYLIDMSEQEFMSRLDQIELFLQAPKAQPFTSQFFSQLVSKNVTD